MKNSTKIAFVAFVGFFVPDVSGATLNPIGKVVDMLASLQAKVIKEGAEAQKLYTKFSRMCEDRSQDLHNEIKTAKANVQELTSTIEKANADITVLEEKISDFAGTVSEDEADLKEATEVREKEHASFAAEEKELQSTISTIERATAIVEKEMTKGSSLAQIGSMQSVADALRAMVDAQAVNSADGANLMALVQSSSDSDEDSLADALGAPNPATYKSHSGSIVETLDGLLQKAEGQLEDARKTEKKAMNAYQMQKESLEDKIAFGKKEMGEAKKSRAATEESKASATGDLDVTKKDLAEDVQDLADLHHECMTEATNFEESTKTRGEELKALAEAKKIIEDSTGGAEKQTYELAQTSFVQVTTKESLEATKIVNKVRHLAMKMRSSALLELSNRMEVASRSHTRDPFAKVKDMIQGMILDLEKELEEAATKKMYCDTELAKTDKKKEDKESDIDQLTTHIDVMAAKSKKLKREVANLQKELSELSKTQAEMDELRAEEKAVYQKNKPELEQGLKGVRMASKVLRDYYGKDEKTSEDDEGASNGIVGMLEVTESDFSKALAEMVAEEESAVNEYEKTTKQNEIDKATKEEDVKYKKKEYIGLDKSIAELGSDRDGVKDELDAIMEYLNGIKKECIAKPDSYEERKERRDFMIAALKDALKEVDGMTDSAESLLQQKAVRRTLRGIAKPVLLQAPA